MFRAFIVVIAVFLSAAAAKAQDNFWVQIEARQTLTSAQDRARDYARRLDDIHGFYLGQGFYGIFIGPFDETGAEIALDRLLDQGAIPRDSFVKDGRRFQQQYWPIGTRPARADTTQGVAVPADPPLPVTGVPSQPSDETPAQALESEAALNPAERQQLQKALQWAGFYDAAIDGAFGRGTRAAMQGWQTANGYDPSGVLTTAQRAALLNAYNAVLAPLRMRVALDEASGIQMQIPTAAVTFTEYQPPFVKFEAMGDIPQAQVLFISQTGDAGRLQGLYEVLQVLDVVPPEGPRQITGDRFVIEGINDNIHTYATATLQDGAIKGFLFVWPAGDDARRTRILDEMQGSFMRLDGTLDPDIVPPSPTQAIDMVAGLSVRQPRLSRSGFFVSQDGHVVTTPAVLDECERITLDRDVTASVLLTDLDLGVTILTPDVPTTPMSVAALETGLPRLQDRVAVAGYPFNGILGAPTLTFGEVVDIRDLTDDTRFHRLSMLPQSGDAGGPILDDAGAVIGMLLPDKTGAAQILPEDVKFTVTAAEIAQLLASQEIAPVTATPTPPLSSVALTRRAADLAVLVSCW